MSLVGVAAILLGHAKTGIWLLVVSIFLRAIVYFAGWWQRAFYESERQLLLAPRWRALPVTAHYGNGETAG